MTRTDAYGSLALPSVLAAAHELKTPLVLMRQLSLQLMHTPGLSDEQKQLQARLQLTAERSLRLVENITQTAQLENALFALEPLQAHSVWQDVVSEIHPLADEMQQTLRLRVSKKPLLVVAHRELLPAVLLGLCDNALSHNPKHSRIDLAAKKTGESIVFSVRDNGPHIEARAFAQLESRLGTSPQPLGTRPNSSGLGLWIAGSFARAMSSQLSVTRHRSGGMTFSLHVPISSQLSLI